MTFFAFFFLFFVSFCSSVDPTGLKVRITDRAHDVLRDVGLEFLKQFLNEPFKDFSRGGLVNYEIKGFTLTSLTVRPENLRLTFLQNSGLQFQMKDLGFTAHFQRDINLFLWRQFKLSSSEVVLRGSGLSATIAVTLRNQQGRLNAEIPTCEFNANNIVMTSQGILGSLLDSLTPALRMLINAKSCGYIRTGGVSQMNDVLRGLSMEMLLLSDRSIGVDYSLSGDVAVTTSSIDVPFKGLVFFGPNRNDDVVGKDPFFSRRDRMAYVGVSDVFFKSSAQAIFRAGPIQTNIQDISKFAQFSMKLVGIPTGLVQLELDRTPTVSISSAGVSVQAAGTLTSVDTPQKSFSLNCKIDMKIDIKGDRLFLPHVKPKCDVKPRNVLGKILKPIVKSQVKSQGKTLMKSFIEGLRIPLPEGVSFSGEVSYQEGFVVFGGDLSFGPSGAQALVNRVRDFGR